MRTYRRDRRGRFASGGGRKPSKKYGRAGAVAGGVLLWGGPAFMPLGAYAGFAAGRALDRRINRRRS